jgi:hypothetical protein
LPGLAVSVNQSCGLIPNSAFQKGMICVSLSSSMLVSFDSDQNVPTVHFQALASSFDCQRISWVQDSCLLVMVFGVE